MYQRDSETERAIIGCMTMDSASCITAMEYLDVSDFQDPTCAHLFEKAVWLTQQGKRVDIISLNDVSTAGIQYIGTCSDTAFPSNIYSYVSSVKIKSIRRKHLAAANEISSLAMDETLDVLELQSKALAAISKIETPSKEPTAIRDIGMSYAQLLEQRMQEGDKKVAKYGLTLLDNITGGLRPGELTVLAARPGCGKTAIALQTAVWNGKNGRKTAFFSLEMPTYQLMERMVVSDSGIYGGKLRNPNSLDATDWSKTSASISRLCELPVEIIDCIYTVEGIKLRAQQLQLQGQVDLVVVDYLGLCRTSSRVNSRYEEVSIMSRLFKLMAKDLKVPVLLLAQLNRENVKDKRPPMVVDLRDSGTIEQDADVILLMHDPLATTAMESPPAVRTIELAIAKNRHGQAGRTMELEFYTGMQRFASKQG